MVIGEKIIDEMVIHVMSIWAVDESVVNEMVSI